MNLKELRLAKANEKIMIEKENKLKAKLRSLGVYHQIKRREK